MLVWPARAVEREQPIPVAPLEPVCACCAEQGEWYESTDRIQDHELNELSRLRLDGTIKTFVSGGDDGNPFAETYSVTHVRRGRRWELRVRDSRGGTGTLSFTLPTTVTSYGVDQHQGSGETVLYKEMRLSAPAQATGIFRRNLPGALRVRIILQGQGNRCLNAEDFKHWLLQVSSPRATYGFFGGLTAAPAQN